MGIYTPDEPEQNLFLERTFIAGDVICGIGYGTWICHASSPLDRLTKRCAYAIGIQLLMFAYCAAYLWKQRRVRKHGLFILGYITLIFIVETIFLAVQARTVQICYIDNRNYPGGPWQFFLATQNLPVNVMFYATLFLITFLCDCLVVVVAMLGHLDSLWAVRGVHRDCITGTDVVGFLCDGSAMDPSIQSARPIVLHINILLTILIILRLYLYRRSVLSSLPPEHAKHYLSLATVLVESATLYSIFALLFLITYAVNNPTNQVWLGVAQATQQISTYLIIFRLADGRAWKSDTLQQTLTTVQFGVRTVGKTTETETVGGSLEPFTSASGSESNVFESEKGRGQLSSLVVSESAV
ncbi:hypothetical protein NM688_g338 [Phlebia brevispora]|uniref:Uncharacterized protein n=1 Tax=Phlebia brevispora TaxID=194682 RepID=A0ACC1TEJ4_9APHY|nr:hypothetical protein NM688_g338 [Phlebia brevispora]